MQAQSTINPTRPDATRPHPQATTTFAYAWSGIAIASIWISVVLASVWAPDFVSGSKQEHLPLVGLTAWLWGAIATGIVVLAALEGVRTRLPSQAAWMALGLGVGAVWLGVLLVSVFGPVFVTGSDPTRIPLASLGAGIIGVFGTWFVCLFVKAAQIPQASATATTETRLRELAALRDSGAITPQDFESAKAELLRRL